MLTIFCKDGNRIMFDQVLDGSPVPAGCWAATEQDLEGQTPGQWVKGKIWDDSLGRPRDPNASELLAKVKAEQEALVRDAANAESTREVRPFEARIVAAKWARSQPLTPEETAIFTAETNRYTRLVSHITAIRGATTVEAVKAVVW